MQSPECSIFPRFRHSAFGIQHLAILFLASLLIFSHSMSTGPDHDEHQFVASAALLSRRGLMPYRDYPYFHTPYLAYADAVMFRLAGINAKLLLTARLLCAACSIATVALLYAAVLSLYANEPQRIRRWAAPTAVLLLVTNPVFAVVTGLAWNHDAAEVLLLAAALLLLREIRRASFGPASMLVVGALLGLGIGVRLTIAPAVLALAGSVLADTRMPWRRRLAAASLLLLGTALALLPCGWLFLQSPRAFLFGNFVYPTLNTAWRIAHGSMTSSTTPIGKIAWFLSRVVFSSGTGFLLMLIGLTIWLRREKPEKRIQERPRVLAPWVERLRWVRCLGRTHGASTGGRSPLAERSTVGDQKWDHGRHAEANFLAVVILFLLVGSFAPAPMFMVYFYSPVPFAVLWLAYAWRPLLKEKIAWHKCAATALVFACLACGVPAYRHLATAFHPSRWVPLEEHNSGVVLRRQLAPSGAPQGPILTLAPIIPMEGGLDIYEQFTTGPFAFRAAPMVPETERKALHLVDEYDLSELLKVRPPTAVLFNVEEREEEMPMLRAVPKGCLMIRLVHGSSFSFDRASEPQRR